MGNFADEKTELTKSFFKEILRWSSGIENIKIPSFRSNLNSY